MTTITNSTISGNRLLSGSGGGIYANGTLILRHTTITENTADGNGGGLKGVVGTPAPAMVTVHSSIIADNTGGDVDDVAVTSDGFNLVGTGNVSTDFNHTGDQVGVSAGLRPLADNGGPTLTHAPLPGSLAINAGDTSSTETFDQRERPVFRGWSGRAAGVGAFRGSSATGAFDRADRYQQGRRQRGGHGIHFHGQPQWGHKRHGECPVCSDGKRIKPRRSG